MASRRDRTRRPARRTRTVEPKKRILVVCEGSVTEPEYIRGFCASRRNPLVSIKILGEHGVPRTLVEAAKKAKQAALLEAKSHNDDNLTFDSVWCVFDVDEHPGVSDALQMARDNDILVALSNPCFELWLLLHFRDNPGTQDRHSVQKMVKSYVSDFGKHVRYDDFTSGYEIAKERAAQLQRIADEDGESTRNPTTGVFRLTMTIE